MHCERLKNCDILPKILVGFIDSYFFPIFYQSREQRVTGIFVFLLTGLSVFMAPILKVVLKPPNLPWKQGLLSSSFRKNTRHLLKFEIISDLVFIRLGASIVEVI